MVPVPKVNPPSSIHNDLRPISLLPTLAKVFESIVGKLLLTFLEPNFDDNQFGSREGRSTTHAVVALLHSWMPCLDAGGSVRTVFVDFRKAFDLVNHNILFNKLQKYDETTIALSNDAIADPLRPPLPPNIREWPYLCNR